MFIWNWFSGILNYLGLAHKNAKILFLGIDNAGKTTLLHVLKDDRIATHVPTLHPHSEELVIGSVRFRTYDLGGHETARRIWKDYFTTVDAVIYMVDAADRNRFPEAKEALEDLFAFPELDGVPFAVLGNKVDLPTAVTEDELRRELGLGNDNYYGGMGGDNWGSAGVQNTNNAAGRKLNIFMCSIVKGVGYRDAFVWVGNQIE
eukprot:GHVH01004753.1.p1 GENE.GHVH01004753.1~~GHVH01004753.1.p1  ORF type:complete len:204 (+),score=23.94 GHVH01004753.1:184-795(+)